MNTLALIVCASSLLAADPAKGALADAPTKVSVGLYPTDVYDLDLRKCSYTVDCYIWLRWTGDLDPADFEFMNGSMDLKEHPDKKEINGVKYISFHCRGNFHTPFDFHKYPLDSHTLAIFIEDANHDAVGLQYVVDHANLRRSPSAKIAGWNCNAPRYEVQQKEYETNYGNPTRSSSQTAVYSRFCMLVDITHAGSAIYLKTFLGLFISVAIAFLGFLIYPTETDARFGVGVAAIFGSVSSEIIISSNLPDMPYFTLADKIHFVSFTFVFLSLLLSCISLRLANRDMTAAWQKLDRICIVVVPLCYVATIVGITWFAINV